MESESGDSGLVGETWRCGKVVVVMAECRELKRWEEGFRDGKWG